MADKSLPEEWKSPWAQVFLPNYFQNHLKSLLLIGYEIANQEQGIQKLVGLVSESQKLS